MSKEDSLIIIKEKFDSLYKKLEGESGDYLGHLCESGEITITSLICFDQSHGDYRVNICSYNLKDGYKEDTPIYTGDNEDDVNQVFENMLDAYDASAIWKAKDGSFSM